MEALRYLLKSAIASGMIASGLLAKSSGFRVLIVVDSHIEAVLARLASRIVAKELLIAHIVTSPSAQCEFDAKAAFDANSMVAKLAYTMLLTSLRC